MNNEQILNKLKKIFLGKTIENLYFETNNKLNIDKLPKNALSNLICRKYGLGSFKKMTDLFNDKYEEFLTFKTLPFKSYEDYSIKEGYKINVNLPFEAKEKNEWSDTYFGKILNNEFIVFLYKHDYNDFKKSKIFDIVRISFNDEDINGLIEDFDTFKYKYLNGGLIGNNGKNFNLPSLKDGRKVYFNTTGTNAKDKFITPAGEEVKKISIWFSKEVILDKIKK